MNCSAAIVYPFFSQEKGCATVCVLETRLQKALVCILEFDIAQKTDILNFGQQSQANFGKTFRANTLASTIRMNVDTFQISRIVRESHNIRLEEEFVVF